jgi:subtilisin family serine protease
MFNPPPLARATVAIGLALLALAVDPLSTQGQRHTRNASTTMIDGHEAVEGEVIVRYRAGSGAVERDRAEFQVNTDESEAIGRRGARRLRSRRFGTRQMLQTLRDNPDVEYVEPNFIIRLDAVPNDPGFGQLWGLFNSGQNVGGSAGRAGADIGAPAAWDYTTGSRANVVGIVDTGVDYNHPDLAANMWSAPRAFSVTIGGVRIDCAAGTHGFNAITNSCYPMDDHSHGTHVAGTIGAIGNNGVGVAGVNWVASMMALKFLSASGSGSTSDAIKAIEFAVQAKAVLGSAANVRILSNSWGGGGYSVALGNEIEAANTADMLFVAAAGNDSSNNDSLPSYPASYTNANVVSVASSTNQDTLSSFSNYGAVSVDLAAPGSSVYSTIPNASYGYKSGTSMATPHVSGAAALVLSACPSNTATLKSALVSTVFPVANFAGKMASGGRLDVASAIANCVAPRPATMTVNGSTGALTVPAGASMSVVISNPGPANTWDYVMIAPVGAAANYWTGAYQFLNGTTTLPLSPIRNATLSVRAPSTAGTYELRFNAAGQFNRLATSGAITITVPVEPPPPPPAASSASISVNGSTGALTVAPNAAMTVVLTNPGSGDVWDYVMAAPTGAPSDYWTGVFQFLNGTTTLPTSVIHSATITVRAPSTAGTYELRFNAAGKFNRLATSGVITVAGTSDPSPPAPAPPSTSASMTVNGTGGALTVTAGAAMNVVVSNPGTADAWDYVMVAPTGAASNYWSGVYQFLNGTTTLPASAIRNATISVAAPTAPGTYEVRFNARGQFERLATSGVITVASSSSSPPPPSSSASITVNGSTGSVTVGAGASMSVAVANSGTTNTWDYVMVAPVGAPANYWSGVYQFLNGTTTLPSSPISAATISVTAPATPGSYEVRFNAAGQFNRLATSGVVTVVGSSSPPVSPSASITVNGVSSAITVAPGSPMTVVVNNSGATNVWDYVMVAPVGAPTNYWTGVFQFLNGTTTLPTSALAGATLSVPAPSAPGSYEVRFNAAGQFGRLATSAIITVQ